MIKIADICMILTIYAIINIIVFSLFAYDKKMAQKNAWRTPENQLLFYALVGPFGAYASMLLFRHKTRKLKFCIVPVATLLHLALLIYLLNITMNK
jgi:uncharacterized membrane protein YsdA (DUF1294 family)